MPFAAAAAAAAGLLLLAGRPAAAQTTHLVVGDSMGDYACGNPEGLAGGSFLSDFCAGSTVTNVAVSGSAAWQWRENGALDDTLSAGFQTAGATLTHVWLTVGGNDFMTPAENVVGQSAPGDDAAACSISAADVQTRVQAAVDNVQRLATAGNLNVKIILFGYCQPFISQCPASVSLEPLSTALAAVAAATAGVEYHDVSARCGGKPSDASYFVPDGLHLNRKGYCAVFGMDTAQTALGCAPQQTFDCSQAFGSCASNGGGAPTSAAPPPAPTGDTSTEAYTFPVKSIGLAQADGIEFYSVNSDLTGSLGTVTDLHAVHGVQTPDGGYVMCGKGLESEAVTFTEAFCVKYSSTGATLWAWKSDSTGSSDAANAVVVLNNNELAVVGWKTVAANRGTRFITKLKIADGTEVWTADSFTDTGSTTSFYEMIEVSGNDVYLAGGINKPNTDEMAFKSVSARRSIMCVCVRPFLPTVCTMLTAATTPMAEYVRCSTATSGAVKRPSKR